MQQIKDHINIIVLTSTHSKNQFLNKEQNEIDRFVYCGIQKLSKISIAIQNLYIKPESFVRLEFGIGVLCRSALMDMILMMEIKHLIYTGNEKDFNSLKETVRLSCLKFLSDGTEQLIKSVLATDKYSREEKNLMVNKFLSLFHDAFDKTTETPKLKRNFRVSLSEIIKTTKHELNTTGDDIIDLYSFYSKYDHLSHWTSLTQKFDPEKRLSRFETSLRLMILHLRNLLALAFDFEGHVVLQSYMIDLDEYLRSISNKEDLK